MQKTIPLPPSSFSSLPDEITENILARVSRWRYPLLSLVSKRFHSLLSYTEIYKTRSQIGANETCSYVCLQSPNHQPPSWFNLWSKPNHQTLTKMRGKIRFKKDSSGNTVTPINGEGRLGAPLTVGSELYIIGGTYKEPSSSVRILDCRNHTWRDAPNMTVARGDASSAFIDDKIYVMGGCDIDNYSANWLEVFDIKTQSWTAMPTPGPEEDELRNSLCDSYGFNIVNVFQGKLYVATEDKKDYTYNPRDGTWKLVREKSSFLFDSIHVWYEMENVLYCCTDSGDLMWSDSGKTEGREWREIKGLDMEKLREHRTRGLKTRTEFDMGECGGGKLLVMWKPYPICRRNSTNKIWYAKICLESRCNGLEVWGKVECVDVLTFPVESYKWFYCLTASV